MKEEWMDGESNKGVYNKFSMFSKREGMERGAIE